MRKDLRESTLVFGFLLAVLVVAQGFAQRLAGQQDFDVREVDREIEVMKSILSTSLSLLEDEGEGASSRRDFGPDFEAAFGSRVEGLYLHGQGVVFTVRVPAIPSADPESLVRIEERLKRFQESGDMDDRLLEAQVMFLQSRLDVARQQLDSMRMLEEDSMRILEEEISGMIAPGADTLEEGTDAVEIAPDTARAAEFKKQRAEMMKARIEAMKEELKRTQKNLGERRVHAEEMRGKIIEEIVRVLANHGDSLSQLASENYVNVVMEPGSSGMHAYLARGVSLKGTILSVKKSDILDYKAGRISREQFNSRVLQY